MASGKWEAIHVMPAIAQTIDASDKDGGVHIDDNAVKGMPMPDTIHAFAKGGHTYVVTANEGDFNPSDSDKCRVKSLGKSGAPALNAAYKAQLDALYNGNALADAALGRLNVSIRDGLNASGEIEQLYVPGTRSFSILDASTGEVVYDSGSDFETKTALLDPSGYNDDRSDDKGPEPEALCIFEMGGERYVAIGMERTYGIFLYNISDPANAHFVDYFRANALDQEPECITFLPAGSLGDDVPRLVVGYELSKSVNVITLNTWHGYPASTEGKGLVDTGDWLGWLYRDGDWAYAYGISAWIYLPESWSGATGGWAYIYR
jgi:hypothetical protein